jgi:predicted nucleic acid-binding protein
MIAVLKHEPGAHIVVDIIQDVEADIAMHKLNLLEVYYDVYRRHGQETADSVIQEVRRNPIEIISEITDEVFAEAGRLKAAYKISLADSIALAEASVLHASLATSDHHEFDPIEQAESIEFLWIR